jgi:hypothetical protein
LIFDKDKKKPRFQVPGSDLSLCVFLRKAVYVSGKFRFFVAHGIFVQDVLLTQLVKHTGNLFEKFKRLVLIRGFSQFADIGTCGFSLIPVPGSFGGT